MKKTILVPMLLGLLVTGCSQDDSHKYASSYSTSQPDASKSEAKDTAKKDTAPDAAAVASTPAPAAETKASTDPSATAATPAPLVTAAPQNLPAQPTPPIANTAAESGTTSGPASLASRMAEWKLGASDIKDEFEKTGRIERTKSPAPGAPTGPMDNGLITSMVRSKFEGDAVISALNLSVEAKDGTVTLSGSAHGLDQIGRAIAFALEVEGVNKAVSLIKLDSNSL